MGGAAQTIFAPAKVNLYLHVTGKRADGYHLLDSIAAFADIGDKITLEPARGFSFQVTGPYANHFTAQDVDAGPQGRNLAVRAARALATQTGVTPDVRITLHKNLPLASGLGGASADAAAVLWGLMAMWGIPAESDWLLKLATSLGADVPACLASAPVRFTGIGDVLTPLPSLPEMPVVLANPGKACPTPEVFRSFAGRPRDEVTLPLAMGEETGLIDFLRAQANDLTDAAIAKVPDIAGIIEFMALQPGCRLARMSGSGASVFGLFASMDEARQAAEDLSLAQPKWWVRAGTLNRPVRY